MILFVYLFIYFYFRFYFQEPDDMYLRSSIKESRYSKIRLNKRKTKEKDKSKR